MFENDAYYKNNFFNYFFNCIVSNVQTNVPMIQNVMIVWLKTIYLSIYQYIYMLENHMKVICEFHHHQSHQQERMVSHMVGYS